MTRRSDVDMQPHPICQNITLRTYIYIYIYCNPAYVLRGLVISLASACTCMTLLLDPIISSPTQPQPIINRPRNHYPVQTNARKPQRNEASALKNPSANTLVQCKTDKAMMSQKLTKFPGEGWYPPCVFLHWARPTLPGKFRGFYKLCVFARVVECTGSISLCFRNIYARRSISTCMNATRVPSFLQLLL